MKSLEELKKIREEAINKVKLRQENNGIKVVVGMATCGISAGARPVLMTLIDEVNRRSLDNVIVNQTGCIGMCTLEPIVEVYPSEGEKVTYINMNSEKAKRIIAEHIVNGNVVEEYTIGYSEK